MAAKTGVKASGAKSGAAKPAVAPKTLEGAEQSGAAPGVGAPADNQNEDGGTSSDATDAPPGESEDAKALREAAELSALEAEAWAEDTERTQRLADVELARLEDEAWLEDEERTRGLVAVMLARLEEEAYAEDEARTERLKSAQTTTEEPVEGAVTLDVWALPEISEFPATVTLENHTRNRIAVAGVKVALDAYETTKVEVSQEQFAKLAKALTSSARAHKWDNFKGLQVKYDRKN